jgi:hypothetical protein
MRKELWMNRFSTVLGTIFIAVLGFQAATGFVHAQAPEKEKAAIASALFSERYGQTAVIIFHCEIFLKLFLDSVKREE